MTPPARLPLALEELIQQLKDAYPAVTPQFQQGARFLIDHPDQVPLLSMRRLANQAGVQPATLVRLAQHMGFAGWDAMKPLFMQALQSATGGYAAQARHLVGTRRHRGIVERMLAAQTANLQQLLAANEQALPAAVQLLSQAPHVHVAGFRASFATAHAFHYQYRLFRPTVTLVRGDAGTLEMELRAMRPRDVLVVFSFAPYSREIIRVAEYAAAHQAQVLAVCDSQVAPMALQARTTLVFPTGTPSFFPSNVAATALAEVLIEQLLAKAGKRAVRGLELAESELQAAGAYWQRPAT